MSLHQRQGVSTVRESATEVDGRIPYYLRALAPVLVGVLVLPAFLAVALGGVQVSRMLWNRLRGGRAGAIEPPATGTRRALTAAVRSSEELQPETIRAAVRVVAPEQPARTSATPFSKWLRPLEAASRRPYTYLTVATLAIGVYAWKEFLDRNYSFPVVAIWLLGLCGFLMLSAWPATWRPTSVIRGWRSARTEWVLATVVLLIGSALRLYHPDSIPYGLNGDAAYEGIIALVAKHSGSFIPWSFDPNAGETLFDYWILANMSFLGHGSLAIRGTGAIAGIITLFGMYLFTRRVFGVELALIATFLVGTSGWHIIFARTGWRTISLPMVETFALYFLFRAIQTRRRGSFAICGTLMALILYTYLSGRIIPAMAALYGVVALCRGPNRVELLRGYAIAAIAFLYAGALMLAFARTDPGLFNARYNAVSTLGIIEGGNWSYLWQHLKYTAGVFTSRATGNDFFLEQPLLDLPDRWLFLLGLPIALWMSIRRSWTAIFLLLSLVLVMIPPFVADWPNGNRSTGAVPFVFVLAALPLWLLLRLARQVSPRAQSITYTTAVLGVVVVLLSTLVGAFDQYLGPDRTFVYGFSPQITRVAEYMNQIDDRYDVYFVDSDFYHNSQLVYLTAKSDDPSPPLAGGLPIAWRGYHDNGTPQKFPHVPTNHMRGVAIITPYEDYKHVIAVLPSYPGAIAVTLMYRDGAVYSPASDVILIPPSGTSVWADIPSDTARPLLQACC